VSVPGAGPASFEPDGEPVGTAVLVPGRAYPPVAPLLFFAGQSLLLHGWRVEQLWWDPPDLTSDEQADAGVRDQVAAALPASGRALVVAKSLGTRAAPLVAERRLPAVWLTPLLDHPPLVAAIAANPAAQLLVGGSADPYWNAAVAGDLAAPTRTVCEVADADHALLVPGDVPRGVEAHAEVARALDAWLSNLPG
jgi:predicted alpha/beta-hydrolase family hydrolase